jgi:hypothetical protein
MDISTLSCQSASQIREKREEEILEKGKEFLWQVAYNLCIPEGISGKIDMALKINRQKLVAQMLRETAKRLEEEEL